MRILLDTHCWLWMDSEPERFSESSRTLVQSSEHDLALSAASVWEIATKYARGKLRLPKPPGEYVEHRLVLMRTRALSVEYRHALRTGELPPHHRDPFDRLLIAQAQIERMPILTADPQFDAYDVEIIKAV